MTFLLKLGYCPPSTLDQLCLSDKPMENTSLESLAELPLLWQPQCVQTLPSHWQPAAHVLFQKQLNVLQCHFLLVPTKGSCSHLLPPSPELTWLPLPSHSRALREQSFPWDCCCTLGTRAGRLAVTLLLAAMQCKGERHPVPVQRG